MTAANKANMRGNGTSRRRKRKYASTTGMTRKANQMSRSAVTCRPGIGRLVRDKTEGLAPTGLRAVAFGGGHEREAHRTVGRVRSGRGGGTAGRAAGLMDTSGREATRKP